MIGLERDQVSLCLTVGDFWGELFQKEQEKLSQLLMCFSPVIEHVGSTSIQGIWAKPIIDVAIGVKDFAVSAPLVLSRMEEGGYEYRENHGDCGRMVFLKTEQTKRLFHIHIEEYRGTAWNNHIEFRNALQKSYELRAEYSELKKSLAFLYAQNREQYTAHKDSFMKQVLSSCIT